MNLLRALLLMGPAAIVATGAVTFAAVAAPEDEPLALFEKLMPVFTHPRCVNCHGAVSPSPNSAPGPTGIVHGGDPYRNEPCADCHDQAGVAEKWKLAPSNLSFVGKNTLQLCRLQSEQVGKMDWLAHISEDVLIQQSFEGMSGGARTLPADPAPGGRNGHPKFLELAMNWRDAGAGCGTWTGTITQVEELRQNYRHPTADPNSTMTEDDALNRTFAITRKDGQATADITVSGHQSSTSIMQAPGNLGACTVTVVSKKNWGSATPGGAAAKVNVRVSEDGTYAINVLGPPEKIRIFGSSDAATNTCGVPFPPSDPDEPYENPHAPYSTSMQCPPDFRPDAQNTIDCDIFDPEISPKRLKGTMTRMIGDLTDQKNKGQLSWLWWTAIKVRGAGANPLPVKVTTTWDLVLEEPQAAQ